MKNRIAHICRAGTLLLALTSCNMGDNSTPVTTTPNVPAVEPGWVIGDVLDSSDDGNVGTPGLAVYADGSAIVVWEQDNGVRTNIWYSVYSVVHGWGTAALLENDDNGYAYNPDVAFNSQGEAMAVWNQSVGVAQNIYASTYSPSGGWSVPVLIESTDFGDAYTPKVAFDQNDNAMVAWAQADGVTYNIYANRYDANTGWEGEVLIETDNAGDAFDPLIAVTPGGDTFMVAWHQDDGTRENVWANRYETGAGWLGAALVETNNVTTIEFPRIAMDSNGNAIVVWLQEYGSPHVLTNRYVAGVGWGTPEEIEIVGDGAIFNPDIAIDSDGNAFAVWRQHDGGGYKIAANRYVSGTGWAGAEYIQTSTVSDGLYPAVAFDLSGNALVVWSQYTGTENAWSRLYVVGVGWTNEALVDLDGSMNVQYPKVAFDADGRAIAVMKHQNFSSFDDVYAVRYE